MGTVYSPVQDGLLTILAKSRGPSMGFPRPSAFIPEQRQYVDEAH